MAQTNIRGTQILNNTVQRHDIDVSTTGQALATRIVAGTNISLSSTGVDAGTGDVTISMSNAPPTGAIMDFAGSSAPTGWLLCDGTSYSTTTQATLFGVIGYSFGGSGGSFNVPNCGHYGSWYGTGWVGTLIKIIKT